MGEKCSDKFRLRIRLPRTRSFTCRKSATWGRRLYFPSEGRGAEDFFTLKNPTVSTGFKPANLGTKDQHATSRPPKPICVYTYIYIHIYVCICIYIYIHIYMCVYVHVHTHIYYVNGLDTVLKTWYMKIFTVP